MDESRSLRKALVYALILVILAYWLPFAYVWFVLHTPWWVAALLVFGSFYLIVDIERRKSS